MYNGLSAQLNNFGKVFFRRNLDFRVCLKRSYDSAHQLVLKTNPALDGLLMVAITLSSTSKNHARAC